MQIGIDLGATKIESVLLDQKGVEILRERNDSPKNYKETIIAKIPSARLGEPEDIANAVLFLASNQSNYINGETIHVNGGMYMAWQNRFLNY